MLKYFIILLLNLGCNAYAQQILPLYATEEQEDVPGAYYKDTFNDFDNFTGTWKFINGNTSITIKLQKRVQYYDSEDNEYSDYLIGEYRYVENGTDKINTLNQLLQSDLDPFSYNITGNIITTVQFYPICSNCNPNEKILILDFNDPTRSDIVGLDGDIILRRVDSGGLQKIELILQQSGLLGMFEDVEPAYDSFNIPWGTYVLIKQP